MNFDALDHTQKSTGTCSCKGTQLPTSLISRNVSNKHKYFIRKRKFNGLRSSFLSLRKVNDPVMRTSGLYIYECTEHGLTLNKRSITHYHKCMCPGTVMEIANPSWWLAAFDPVLHAQFQISDKEFAIKPMIHISVQLEFKYNPIQNSRKSLTE